jgi:molybdate transport system permease protein
LWSALRTSVISATISTAVIAICGIPLAHWLARSTSRLAKLTNIAVYLPLALPPVMSGIILIYLVGPYTVIGKLFDGRLTDSVAGIVLAQTFVAAPFAIIAARSAFASVDPALDDLAATLGHHPFSRFLRVSLPIAAPAIRAGLLLTWLRALGEYGATVLLAYHPYSLPVYTYVRFSGSGLPNTQAPTALALAVAILAVVVTRMRRPARSRALAHLPAPRPPKPSTPTPVNFSLDAAIGTFRLRVAHHATSHRVAILGPSGSGKSLTLKAIAGLLGPRAGVVRYGERLVSATPAEERRVGYVPQGMMLFPGRTVWEQVRFASDSDERLAAWWLSALRVDDLRDRYPHELSGGERQRVALAQALSREPDVVLLDEPFSALDAPVRDDMRQALRRLQREAGLSTVLVTHDPEEAAYLADEIVVIDDGEVLQSGARSAVFDRPASPRVARLLGIHNVNHGRVVDDEAIETGGVVLDVAPHGLPDNTDAWWCVRPDRIAVRSDGRYPAVITDIADLGALAAVTLRFGNGDEPDAVELRVRTTERIPYSAGESCGVDFAPEHVTVWSATAMPSIHSHSTSSVTPTTSP